MTNSDYQPDERAPGRAAALPSVRVPIKAVHQQVQDAHAAHDDQIDDDRPESALFGVFHALVGEGVFALKVFAEHLTSPLSHCSLVIFHWTAWL